MIYGTLEHAARYQSLSPRLEKAFHYLQGFSGTEENGRHEIDGDDVFALVQRYTTKPLEDALFEAHRSYADVQFVHAGNESILLAPLSSVDADTNTTMAYDAEKDAALFRISPGATALGLSAGHFAVLYPEDAHAPGVQRDGASEVVKVVVKVRLT